MRDIFIFGGAVTGIFSRWRQFGRRYFLPHLLLGMVAAGLGLPALNNSTDRAAPSENATLRAERLIAVNLNNLVLLQENNRRASFTVDYWQQHAIRTVIRHLSFVLAPSATPPVQATLPLQAHHTALLDTLSVLLTQERPLEITSVHQKVNFAPALTFSIPYWLSRVRGIRAGPLHLS